MAAALYLEELVEKPVGSWREGGGTSVTIKSVAAHARIYWSAAVLVPENRRFGGFLAPPAGQKPVKTMKS
ncbi:MAG: hypothetical protein V4625_10440 [Pseudomonadota bacterium]